MRLRLAAAAFLLIGVTLGGCSSTASDTTVGAESAASEISAETSPAETVLDETAVETTANDSAGDDVADIGSPNDPDRVLTDCPASIIVADPKEVKTDDSQILQCVNGIASVAMLPEGGDGVVDYLQSTDGKWSSIGQAIEGNDPPTLPDEYTSRFNPLMESDGSPDSCTVLTELYGNCTDFRADVNLEEFQLPTDDGATVSAGLSSVTGSANWRVIFTAISVQGCAQCFGGVGGAAYEKVDGQWVLREKAPLIARVGTNGSVAQPEIAWNSGANSLMLYATSDGEADYSITTLTAVGFNGTFYKGFEEPVLKMQGDCTSDDKCIDYYASVDLVDDGAKLRPSAPSVAFHRVGIIEGATIDDYVVYDLDESGRAFAATTGQDPGR